MPADPVNQRFLERPRVGRLLAKALQSHVVTVVAGEGNGKTHAVSSFLQNEKQKMIWVQISEQDNLDWRFWENYTGAIARINPKAAKILADTGFPESDRRLDRHLSLLKSEIISPERYVTVFDDWQLLTNPKVLMRIEQMLTAPVSKNTIVFISRVEPVMNTVNLLAKGLLSQITVEDLRFTREETAAYFRLYDIVLEKEELDRIFQKTEGWALALGLMLQGVKDGEPGGPKWDRMMRPIREMEEAIFSAMEPDLQKFLIKLSLIGHWPRKLLEDLDPERKNMAAMETFSSVIRFDPYLDGFRIHRSFLEFLQEKQSRLPREEIRELYDKDAQWCIENKLPIAAAVNYEQAGDCGGFVRIVDSLPRMLPRTMAAFFLETAERLIVANMEDPLFRDDDDWDFLCLRFLARARLLMLLGRFEEAVGAYQAGIRYFEAMPLSPRRSRFLAASYNRLGTLRFFLSHFTKDYNIVHYFERGHRYYLENPEPVEGPISQTDVCSYAILVGYPAEPGEIETFINTCSAVSRYTSVSLGGYLCGAEPLIRAELAYYQGDLDKAEQSARSAIYQSREKNQYEIENRALLYLLRISVNKGDVAGIQELERQMKAILEKEEYLNRYIIYDLIMGRLYTHLGLIERIPPWIRKESEEEESNFLIRDFDTLVKVRCLLIEKKYPEALLALKLAQAKSEIKAYLFGVLEMTVLEAVIRHRLKDREGALAALKKAYDIARPWALNMPFIELGEAMYGMAGAILKIPPSDPHSAESAGIPREWLQAIRRSASANAKKCSLVAAQYAGREAPAPADFSQHELAILGSLSLGRTGEEIAVSMKISANMVKSVIRSLYVKLGAANRADAIRIATERGLLTNIPGK